MIAFSGKLSQTQSELKELIEEAGAKYSTTVSGNVDYLISTENDINKNSAKVQNAKSHNVPIMEGKFITVNLTIIRGFSSQLNRRRQETFRQ